MGGACWVTSSVVRTGLCISADETKENLAQLTFLPGLSLKEPEMTGFNLGVPISGASEIHWLYATMRR